MVYGVKLAVVGVRLTQRYPHQMLRIKCLTSLLTQSAELHEAARALVDEANANGGRDNVSVALCRFTGRAKKTGFLSKLQRK